MVPRFTLNINMLKLSAEKKELTIRMRLAPGLFSQQFNDLSKPGIVLSGLRDHARQQVAVHCGDL